MSLLLSSTALMAVATMSTILAIAVALFQCFREERRHHLLATVAQAAEAQHLFYWVDFNTLYTLLQRDDARICHHTLSVLEDPYGMAERWQAFVTDVQRQGLVVSEHRVTYGGCIDPWLSGDACVQFLVYRSGNECYTSAHGPVPEWMIGATQLYFWDDGGCFLRLPAFGDMLLRWRFSSTRHEHLNYATV